MNIKILVLMVSMCLNCHADTLQPRHHLFKSIDGVSLHYVEAGEGVRSVIFVPGWLMPAEIFQQQIAVVSKHYRVIAFDPRGQGQSGVPLMKPSAEIRARDIRELIAHAHVKDYVLVGWSLGVMECLDFLTRYEHTSLRGLVLIDNSIGMGDPSKSRSGAKMHRPTSQKAFREYIRRFAIGMFRTLPPQDLLVAIQKSALKLPPDSAWSLLTKPYPREYYKDAIFAAEVPVWYAITPTFAEQGEDLIRLLPNAKVTVFEDAGHALFVDQSRRFNEHFTRFLDSLQ